MAGLIHLGLGYFIFTKLVLVNLMILFVGLVVANFTTIRYCFYLVTIAYSLVFLYHVANLY